ncbi:USG-1 protein [Dirofilaria immitis]
MAGSGDAAKNALESLFNKTKEVVQTAAETTKEYANVAIGKIIPNSSSQTTANTNTATEQTNPTETGAAIPRATSNN